jgi:hypothetical protein
MESQSYVEAHPHSAKHRTEILSSEICGCFYCLALFQPNEIKDWIDEVSEKETEINGCGQTALCPNCGIDSVIGSKSGYPINLEFLQIMHNYWF